MQAGCDAQPLERLLAGEALANERQHRHILRGPANTVPPTRGERQVFDIASNVRSCHCLSPSRESLRTSRPAISRDFSCGYLYAITRGLRTCMRITPMPMVVAARSTGNCRVPRTCAPPKRDKPAEVTAPVAA